MLDIVAAMELEKRGIDTGIRFAEPLPESPQWDETADGVRSLLRCFTGSTIWKCQWDNNALVRQCTMFEGGFSGIVHVKNADGCRIVIFPWRFETANWMNCTFLRQEQWQEAYRYLTGRQLPAAVREHANIRLHIRISPDGSAAAVTIQNLSLDRMPLEKLEIAPEWEVDALLTTGNSEPEKLTADELAKEELPPMELYLLLLKYKNI